MVNFDEIFERIKQATNTRTQVELASVLDIRQSSISDAKRRNSIPSDWYMKLFEQFGLNPDWLKKASGPMYLRTETGYSPLEGTPGAMVCEDPARYNGPDSKNALVTVYSSQPVAEGEEPQALSRLNVPQSFVFPGLHVIKLDSAGMAPYINKGAYVGVDTSQKHVSSGEMYCARLPYEGMVIKRVFVDTQNGQMLLRSEDREHPEVKLPIKEGEACIAGRICWILQRF